MAGWAFVVLMFRSGPVGVDANEHAEVWPEGTRWNGRVSEWRAYLESCERPR